LAASSPTNFKLFARWAVSLRSAPNYNSANTTEQSRISSDGCCLS
jgi:hypothetical protein